MIRFLEIFGFCIIVLVMICSTSCNKKVNDRVVASPTRDISVKPDFEITEIDTSLLASEEIIPVEKQKFSVVHMIKENCYGGNCPVYEFSLLSDGIAFYSCKSFCKPGRGNYHAYIGRDKAEEILNYIKQRNLLQLNSVYPTNGIPVKHIPVTKFTLSIDEHRSKSIQSYHHTPQSLLYLESVVNQLVIDTDWEKSYE